MVVALSLLDVDEERQKVAIGPSHPFWATKMPWRDGVVQERGREFGEGESGPKGKDIAKDTRQMRSTVPFVTLFLHLCHFTVGVLLQRYQMSGP